MSAFSENPEIVKFVYWDNLTYSPPGSRAPEEWDPVLGVRLYENYLSHCEEAEQLGYAAVSLPEHFGPSSPCPHPNILMAAIAARTSRVRILSGVNLPLLHHPVQLAEQFAMIDVLSGGRLEVGLGRHGDRAAHEHAVDLIDGVLNGYDHPVARADLTPATAAFTPGVETAKVTAWPRPAQPRVPLWVAATSDGSLAAAARRGWGVFTGLNITPTAGGMAPMSIAKMLPRLHRYLEIGGENGHDLTMANIAVSCFTVIAETDRKAAGMVRDGFVRHIEASAGHLSRVAGGAPGETSLEALADREETGLRAVLEAPAEAYLENPFALVGSVETVRDKLTALRAAGLSRFMLFCGGVGTAHEPAWESAAAMAQDVAPGLFAATKKPLRLAG